MMDPYCNVEFHYNSTALGGIGQAWEIALCMRLIVPLESFIDKQWT